MKRLAAWLGITAVGVAALALTALVIVWLLSDRALAERFVARPEHLPQPSPAAVADAARHADLLGCLSCHGEGLTGNDVLDDPRVGSIIAPNLPALARQRTDQQLAAAIRQGIGHDGRALLLMPAAIFARLSDEEVTALIAWIRSLPVELAPSPPITLTALGRLFLILGDLRRQPHAVAEYRRRPPLDLGPEHADGRRMSATICAECHGSDLTGGARASADFNPRFVVDNPVTPDLAIVAAYSPAEFARLMRSGVPPGGRDLGLMSEVARDDFRSFTDQELAALYAYLVERGRRLSR